MSTTPNDSGDHITTNTLKAFHFFGQNISVTEVTSNWCKHNLMNCYVGLFKYGLRGITFKIKRYGRYKPVRSLFWEQTLNIPIFF